MSQEHPAWWHFGYTQRDLQFVKSGSKVGSVGQPIILFPTEIPKQPLDGLPWNWYGHHVLWTVPIEPPFVIWSEMSLCGADIQASQDNLYYSFWLIEYSLITLPSIIYKWSKRLLPNSRPGPSKGLMWHRAWQLITGSPSDSESNLRFLWWPLELVRGQAPAYIRDLLQSNVISRSLRSLVVARTMLKTKGDCAFEVVAPNL